MSHDPEKLTWPVTSEENPGVDINIGDEQYVLKWEDTTIRTYRVGDGEFDHIHHRLPDNKILILFNAMEDVPELVEILEGMNYPQRVDPVPEDIILHYYSVMLNNRLGDFVDGPQH